MAGTIHKNHRQRVKARAQREGFAHFSDHELLESLLFFAIPRVDTNLTAHRLLKEFGSLKGILDADVDALCRVEGIGPSSAILFRAISESMRRYERDCLKRTLCYNTLDKIAEYLRPYFVGLDHECLYAMFFNNRMNLIDCVLVSEGTVNMTMANVRQILRPMLSKNVSSVVLAHNHPDGLTVPSSADLEFTDMLNNHLNELGIVLVEHLIFVDYHYRPIMLKRYGTFRTSPVSKLVESGFYDCFYNVDENSYHIAPLFSKTDEIPNEEN